MIFKKSTIFVAMGISRYIYFLMAILLINITLVRDLKLNKLSLEPTAMVTDSPLSFFSEESLDLNFTGEEFAERGAEEENEKEGKEENDKEDDDLFFDSSFSNFYVINPFSFQFNYHSHIPNLFLGSKTPPPRAI